MAKYLELELGNSVIKEQRSTGAKLFLKKSSELHLRVSLPIGEAIGDCAMEIWSKPSSAHSVDEKVEQRYHRPQEGADFFVSHFKPQGLVFYGCQG